MTSPKFDDAFDEWLQELEAELPDRPTLADVPEHIRELAAPSSADRQQLDDWLWLHAQMARQGRPLPQEGFSERVLARLREDGEQEMVLPFEKPTPARDRRATYATVRRVAMWGSGLAAAVALFGLMIPEPRPRDDRPQRPIEVAKNVEEPLDLPESVRDATTAYLALAKDFAEVVRLTDDDESAPVPEVASDVGGLPTPPFSRVVLESTDRIATGGKGIRTSVQPITRSAIGAFGFLWKDLPQAEEKPST